jgi:transmembrane sensor
MTEFHSSFIDPRLLDRYLANAATPADEAAVLAWTGGDPARTQWLAAIGSARPLPIDTETALTRTKRLAERQRSPRFAAHRLRGRVSLHLTVASALAAVASVVLWRSPVLQRSHTPQRVTSYSTHANQRANVTLPDGSRVTLGPMTQVSVTNEQKDGTRISVVGEAIFTVTRNATQRDIVPFIVQSGPVQTRVLGTSFIVRRYRDDTDTRITVMDGKVSVARNPSSNAGVVLPHGTMAVVRDSGEILMTEGMSLGDVSSAAAGRLVFQNVPLREVVRDISHAYDVDIAIPDSVLADQGVTMAVVVANRSIDEVLNLLVTVVEARYTRTGRAVNIVLGQRVLKQVPTPPSTYLPETSRGR